MPLCRAVNCSSHALSAVAFKAINLLFYFCCLLAYSWMFINPDQAMKIFTCSAILAFIMCCGNIQRLAKNKRLLILPATIIVFGLLQVIWVQIFKQDNSPYLGAYRAYQSAGKTMIFASFVIIAISIKPPHGQILSKLINYSLIFIALIVYAWVIYKYFSLNSINIARYRIELGFQLATGTAYTLTLMALLASQVLLFLQKKIAIPFYFIHFSLSFFAITLTQTRAAILLYPVLSIGLFILHYRHDRLTLIRATIAFMIIGLLAMLPLKPILEQRYINFQTDLKAYNNDNSNTSIGARFAMQEVGIIAGEPHPFGQSLEQRNSRIKIEAQEDHSLRGAEKYLHVHLHNELIDTFSLKGIVGIILLVSFYIAAGYTAYIQQNIVLFIITAAITIYGLSDLLLYSKGGSLSSMLAISLAVMLVPHTTREPVNVKKS